MQNLSDILRGMHLSGGVFVNAEFTAPWGVVSQVSESDCKPFMPVPSRLIAYHYVVEGEVVVDLEGVESLTATSGQLLVLPRNDRHYLASARGIAHEDVSHLLKPDADNCSHIRYGGGGSRAHILCGFLGSDNECDPLLSNLPPLIALNLEPGETGKWVEESIRYAMRELIAGGPAANTSLARLAELLLGEAIREYLEQLSPDTSGWISGLRDPIVGKALALIHGQVSRRWTLEDLACTIVTSRSVLSERFSRIVGVSPIEYHRRCRLERAATRLSQSDQPIATIAFEVGYGSEAAFSRSFKRTYGRSPGEFRDVIRQSYSDGRL